MTATVEKKEYETPSLTVHGSIEQITQGGKTDGILDQAWPVGTPSHFGLFS